MSKYEMHVIEQRNILGYQVATAETSTIVEDIVHSLRQGGAARWLACLNPHSYVIALDDTEFCEALQVSDLLIADGIGVVIASRWLGRRVITRVTGSEVFEGLNAALDRIGGFSVFFLGSTEDCLADIRARFEKDYPHIRFAGGYSPPFKQSWSDEELVEMRSAINNAQADVLWVGMTAPKQEKWIRANLPHLQIRFVGAIGAVFDFYTGRVQRSSPVFQRLGLEWMPRLIQQPRRLWRRAFISAPIFLWHAIRERIRRS